MHVKSRVHGGFGIEMSSNPWRVTMTLSGAGRRANADREVNRKVFEPERGDQAGVNELWSKVIRNTEGYWNGSYLNVLPPDTEHGSYLRARGAVPYTSPQTSPEDLIRRMRDGESLQNQAHDTGHRHYFRQDGACRCGESQ